MNNCRVVRRAVFKFGDTWKDVNVGTGDPVQYINQTNKQTHNMYIYIYMDQDNNKRKRYTIHKIIDAQHTIMYKIYKTRS